MDRLAGTLGPGELAYSSMTRTGRVSRDEVRRRDPGLAAAHEALHRRIAPLAGGAAAGPKGFSLIGYTNCRS